MYNILLMRFKHETNSFDAHHGGLEDYKKRYLGFGKDYYDFYHGTKTESGGYIDFFEKCDDINIIPVIGMDCVPCGMIKKECHDLVLEKMTEAIKANKVDGIALDLHGAQVLDFYEDGEGLLTEELRALVGPDVPIYSTLDLHANVTKKMDKYITAMFSYDSYPHVDQYERGLEAAENLYKALKGEQKVTRCFVKLPILLTFLETAKEPLKSIYDKIYAYEEMPEVVSVSLCHGFFHSDMSECGISVIAQTNNDQALADKIAKDISDMVMANIDNFGKELVELDEAIDKALAYEGGPVVLADISDNPGGGSPGDATKLLQRLIDRDVKNVAVAHIFDPETVQQAVAAGVGSTIHVKLGGKVYPEMMGGPIECDAYVRCITDGRYINKDRMGKGLVNQLGTTALLVVGGIEIIVISFRQQPWDVEVYRYHGINPCEKKILVVKSALHYRNSYGLISDFIMDVNLPGIVNPDPRTFDFKHITRPVSPLDKI